MRSRGRRWPVPGRSSGAAGWSARGPGKGSVIYAGGMLYCLGEEGKAGLIEASPAAFRLVSLLDLPKGEEPVRGAPALGESPWPTSANPDPRQCRSVVAAHPPAASRSPAESHSTPAEPRRVDGPSPWHTKGHLAALAEAPTHAVTIRGRQRTAMANHSTVPAGICRPLPPARAVPRSWLRPVAGHSGRARQVQVARSKWRRVSPPPGVTRVAARRPSAPVTAATGRSSPPPGQRSRSQQFQARR